MVYNKEDYSYVTLTLKSYNLSFLIGEAFFPKMCILNIRCRAKRCEVEKEVWPVPWGDAQGLGRGGAGRGRAGAGK